MKLTSEIMDVFNLHIDNIEAYELDKTGTEYRNPYWALCRRWKGIAGMHDARAEQICLVFEKCLTLAGRTWPLGESDDIDDAREDLGAAWEAVMIPEGEMPLDEAQRRAERNPVRFKTDHFGKKYQRFLNIAYQLQQMVGKKRIIALPVKPMAGMLHRSEMRISDYRRYAQDDGYLKEVRHYSYNPNGKGCSTGFRFTGKIVSGV